VLSVDVDAMAHQMQNMSVDDLGNLLGNANAKQLAFEPPAEEDDEAVLGDSQVAPVDPIASVEGAPAQEDEAVLGDHQVAPVDLIAPIDPPLVVL